MALSNADVQEILGIIDAAPNGEFLLQTEGFSLHVVKGNGIVRTLAEGAPEGVSTAPTVEPAGAVARSAIPPDGTGAGAAPSGAPAADPAAVAVDGRETIASPMLGTFYRAEAPGAAPFVDVGALVEADTIVCIIEVMKMMNSVPAGVAGRIVEICADNATLVEYGEPLFRVEAV